RLPLAADGRLRPRGARLLPDRQAHRRRPHPRHPGEAQGRRRAGPAAVVAAAPAMFDALGVEARTGWRVVARRVVASTNDAAASLVDAGPADRTVVVADRQTSGRGRGGSRFASPPGGLYASLVV